MVPVVPAGLLEVPAWALERAALAARRRRVPRVRRVLLVPAVLLVPRGPRVLLAPVPAAGTPALVGPLAMRGRVALPVGVRVVLAAVLLAVERPTVRRLGIAVISAVVLVFHRVRVLHGRVRLLHRVSV